MTDAFYNKMADVATKLLGVAKFGQEWTITRTTGEVIDDVTGAITPGTTATFTPVGVLTEYSNYEKNDTRIEAGDRKLILDDTVEPLLTDKLTLGSELWTIVDVQIKEPAGVPLVYMVQVRG